MRLIGRIIWVAVAFIAASICALAAKEVLVPSPTITIFTLHAPSGLILPSVEYYVNDTSKRLTDADFTWTQNAWRHLGAAIFATESVLLILIFILAPFWLGPVMGVAIAEGLRHKSFVFYSVGGCIAAVFLPLLGSLLGLNFTTNESASHFVMLTPSGAVGGAVYWLLAGRWQNWRRP